ncbi:MAG: hypothetical protein JO181_19230 [Solirubrobacterales bacterium]|nr:hypothetical protein [Solirubrobacterales bacterium]MBV9797494.1 hypothetical protein [Solirubrobacterales bacterium]
MTTEQSEKRDTEHALTQVFDYISPGTNEGISFSLSRITEDLFVDSFLAGGDISLFTASGQRGTIRSQSSNGDVLSSSGGAPAQFPVSLQVDLNTGTASGNWTLPDGTGQAPSFDLQHVKTVSRPSGTLLLFAGETTSDNGLYSLALLLI